MKASMTIAANRLVQFQELVKLHDLRFCGNPIRIGERAHVEVSAEHLPPGGANAFFADWHRLQTPIVERKASLLKRWLRSCKGRFLVLCPT
jgi:prepilin-type processing-associated H-X9-DG protein